MSPTLSIIVPMYNESAVIRLFYERVTAAVAPMGVSYELLFVDDGSADDTFEQIHAIADADPHVAALRFSRNFGHQAALFAGMSRAAGDFILMMDGDLQHPPELIPELWQQAQSGFDIVYTIRETSEGAGWFKQFTSRAFYALFSYLTDVRLEPNTADFRLISRKVCDTITAMDERDVFLRGVFAWIGFRQKGIPYHAHERAKGVSKYTLKKMFNLSVNGITSFSTVPIRLSLILCAFSLGIAFLYSAYAVYVKLVLHHAVQGWTSLLILLSLFCSGMYVMLGILGEYIAKIHLETKKRPRFIIERAIRK